MRKNRARIAGAALLASGFVAALVVTTFGRAADAQTTAGSVRVIGAELGSRSLMSGTGENPVPIDPEHRVPISMTLRNDGTVPVRVRYLRLSGSVIGIHFVDYQATTTTDIPPGETRVVAALGDFYDVDKVATGYVDAKMQAVDEQRTTLATQPFSANVHGRLVSSEGLLLAELFAFAAISLVDIGVSVSRRRLPRNRFVRGVLFALAAASTVLALVVAAAIWRISLIDAAVWIPATLLATAGGFIVGYLSPGRLEPTAREASEDRVLDLVAADAVARASGEYDRRTTGDVAARTSGERTLVTGRDSMTVTDQSSGGFAPQHESGGFAPQHESGGFSPQTESGNPTDT